MDPRRGTFVVGSAGLEPDAGGAVSSGTGSGSALVSGGLLEVVCAGGGADAFVGSGSVYRMVLSLAAAFEPPQPMSPSYT